MTTFLEPRKHRPYNFGHLMATCKILQLKVLRKISRYVPAALHARVRRNTSLSDLGYLDSTMAWVSGSLNLVTVLPPTYHVTLDKSFHLNFTYF